MLGFIVGVLVGLYVAYDAKQRENNFVGWGIGSALLPVFVAPAYFAKRNLREGETREGGTIWNYCKYFAIYWSLIMLAVMFGTMFLAGDMVNQAGSDAEAAGAVIGAGIGMFFIGGMWIFGLVVALIVGVLSKKNTIVEEGPTGALAKPSMDVDASTAASTV